MLTTKKLAKKFRKETDKIRKCIDGYGSTMLQLNSKPNSKSNGITPCRCGATCCVCAGETNWFYDGQDGQKSKTCRACDSDDADDRACELTDTLLTDFDLQGKREGANEKSVLDSNSAGTPNRSHNHCLSNHCSNPRIISKNKSIDRKTKCFTRPPIPGKPTTQTKLCYQNEILDENWKLRNQNCILR